MALTSKQRAALRGAANTMDPVYQIGKGEIDDTLKQGIADCIAARELIKVKVLENSEYDPREAADILCEALDCDCVQVIGRKFVLFKQKKKESAYAGTPPHKQASTTPAALRLQMCACFTALSPVVEVSDWEIRRGGRSYTVHTLEWLRSCDPAAELYLCVGSDMLLTFTQWYRWQDMLSMAALVVESRTGTDEAALHAAAAALEQAGGRVLFAEAESYPCASSDIRSGKLPPEKWPEVLPQEALTVVRENKLYGVADM